jgi:hypothetical protein
MKILMTKSWCEPEYLDDAMLHGMRTLFGADVVEYPRMWFMYGDSFGPDKIDKSTICARGFTFYGNMNDQQVDRTDLVNKIKNQFFDLIIMHSWYPSDLTPVVLEHTHKAKIVWLDGRDERQILTQYIGTGHYFKRELIDARTDVKPISFAFPREKISTPVEKTRSLAHVIPGDLKTYVYYDEKAYYNQYNTALFGMTKCKNGWDCLRHYEILGSQSVPWFVDLAMCPPRTCTTLPKHLFLQVNSLINQYGHEAFLSNLRDQYEEIREKVMQHFLNNCTTDRLAVYLLDNVR